jgi:hypothetical protein
MWNSVQKTKDGNWPNMYYHSSKRRFFLLIGTKLKITPEREREKLFYLKFKTSECGWFSKIYFRGYLL